MMRKALLVFSLLLSVAAASANPTETTETLDIGSRLELFVDEYLIDRLEGARLQLQRPVPAEVAIRYDQPWEDTLAFYSTVIQDGDVYRLYYRGRYRKPYTTCYAESRDGIHWTKPKLGIVDFDGSRENNVILPTSGQFFPFIDNRPGVPAAQRYKANSRDTRPPASLVGYVSSDAIHWTRIREEPLVPKVLENNFDSQNVMFWSEVEKLYVLYSRHMEGGRRATARATSRDFLNWTPQTLMSYSDTGTTTPSAHLYTNQTQPYFRAPHIYVSMPGRIWFADQRHVTTEEDKQSARQGTGWVTPQLRDFFEKNVDTGGGGLGDRSDGVLLTSRAGSTHWDFTFKESFLRPGIGLNNWTTRNNYPACGVVQTGPGEMSFYVQRDYTQKTAHLQRMTLRLDGFASLHAPYAGGEMVTHPLNFSGNRLEINYATSAAGSFRVEIQDVEGKPLPGFSLSECTEIIGDEIKRVVTWKGNQDVSPFSGKPVRLRLVMKDADLYSLRFR